MFMTDYNRRRADDLVLYLKSTYGFVEINTALYFPKDVIIDKPTRTKKMLSLVKRSFLLIGEDVVKRIFAVYECRAIDIADTKMPFWVAGTFGDGLLSLRAEADIGAVVHETMHAWDRGLLDNAGAKMISKVNGRYAGYTDANQYASKYAAKSAVEDFAETCTVMIVYRDAHPCKKSSILYKKYVACYELLVERFGAQSNAAQRAAAFLSFQRSRLLQGAISISGAYFVMDFHYHCKLMLAKHGSML